MAIIQISLLHGSIATIDEQDRELIARHSWREFTPKHGKVTYAVTTILRSRHMAMHRLILGLENARILCDHRDGNGLNNVRSNLRIATDSQNRRNQGRHRDSPYRFKGIRHRPTNTNRPWIAVIGWGTPPVSRYLGAFATDEEAARAYDNAAREFFGEFARLNFPMEGEVGI